MSSPERLVVAMTGASGAAYALKLIAALAELAVPFDLLVSPAAERVLQEEIERRPWLEEGRAARAAFGLEAVDVRLFDHRDVGAAIASGTALRRGMVVLPCSMGTLGRIVAGISSSLIERAADVCLKERRPLVLCPRETPLSLVHLRNMVAATEAGAMVLPCSPGFYHGARSIDDLLTHVVAKVLDALAIEHDLIRRWGS